MSILAVTAFVLYGVVILLAVLGLLLTLLALFGVISIGFARRRVARERAECVANLQVSGPAPQCPQPHPAIEPRL